MTTNIRMKSAPTAMLTLLATVKLDEDDVRMLVVEFNDVVVMLVVELDDVVLVVELDDVVVVVVAKVVVMLVVEIDDVVLVVVTTFVALQEASSALEIFEANNGNETLFVSKVKSVYFSTTVKDFPRGLPP